MDTYKSEDVISVCLEIGDLLKVPEQLDGRQVMLAMAAVESGGADPNFAGHNCGPRHEPAYDVNGAFWTVSPIQQQLMKDHGFGAACSYGPWQMMFCNFSEGYKPEQLRNDLHLCAVEFIRQFNRFAARWDFKSLEEIGEVWNRGSKKPDPDYTNKLAAAYAKAQTFIPVRQE